MLSKFFFFIAILLSLSLEAKETLIVSHKGYHNLYPALSNKCQAKNMIDRGAPPEFSAKSIEMAFAMGADVVEIDLRLTKDNRIILFHDEYLNCMTNLKGRTTDHNYDYLKDNLDLGYGMSFDGGNSYPLREKYKHGLLDISELLRLFPNKKFLINPKDKSKKFVMVLKKWLRNQNENVVSHFMFWGSRGQYRALKKEFPKIGSFIQNHWQSEECLSSYRFLGWLGYTSDKCDGKVVTLEETRRKFIWGWPDKFIKRFKLLESKIAYFLPKIISRNHSRELRRSGLDYIIVSDLKTFVEHNSKEK